MGMAARHMHWNIAIFFSSYQFHGHREREMAFREVMERMYPKLRLLPAIETAANSERSYE